MPFPLSCALSISTAKKRFFVFAEDSKLLILDEATSCLNPSMEARVLRGVREVVFRDATVLTITHRVRSVLGMDRVIVLDRGRVREFDSPAR